jgi:hypothetical protein
MRRGRCCKRPAKKRLGLAEGPVEFGQAIERLGLALDQRLGPGGGQVPALAFENGSA